MVVIKNVLKVLLDYDLVHTMVRLFRTDENTWLQSGGRVTIFVDDKISNHMMAGIVVVNPGQRIPSDGYSIHEESDELAYVVEGKAVFGTDEKEFEIQANDLLFNPKGTKHYVRNDGPVPCKIVWALSPPMKL